MLRSFLNSFLNCVLKLRNFFIALLFITQIFSFSVFADGVCRPDMTKRVIDYIKSLDNIAIEFEQKTQNSTAQGLLIIKKPYNFRVNYDIPYPLMIAGGKNAVYVYDYDLDSISHIDRSDNVFDIILSSTEDIGQNFTILNCDEVSNILNIDIQMNKTHNKFMIIFDQYDNNILSFIIPTDENNKSNSDDITINFINMFNLNKVPETLFVVHDTKIYGKPSRFSNYDLLKLITQ